MKKLAITILFSHLVFLSFSQTTHNDTFDYLIEAATFQQIHCGRTINKTPVDKQFESFLKQRGKEGWELVLIENSQRSKPGYCIDEQLIVNLLWKKLKYSTKEEIEKQVAFYSKKYADSTAMVMMEQINKITWSQMGKHYKDEIVNEIIQKMRLLLEADKEKISAAVNQN